MSGVKHTPGPWEAREVRTQVGRAFRIGAGEMLEAGKGCCIIYDDYCGNPDNERKANARLIAAAPDLLEAGVGLLAAYRAAIQLAENTALDGVLKHPASWASIMEAAIARARGEQDGGGE